MTSFLEESHGDVHAHQTPAPPGLEPSGPVLYRSHAGPQPLHHQIDGRRWCCGTNPFIYPKNASAPIEPHTGPPRWEAAPVHEVRAIAILHPTCNLEQRLMQASRLNHPERILQTLNRLPKGIDNIDQALGDAMFQRFSFALSKRTRRCRHAAHGLEPGTGESARRARWSRRQWQ